ncbi:protein gamma response 1 [Magnolia sinica]|uniref:protein gamma response 1 n=1 Tax=Magnolia sinica TaxID=86752 RepID=UPI00265AAB43|nr:protein gamma response 1 [Magnolia sinica]XP_058071629.1 protein gamma response 1 [Magnolia sinica]XP_058071638.1 protein gamma response 1 [Magnolia sinica]XP_058071646.1 protein gamma response 1 [Magnolia sinica]XP_058071647.1 protein gamma response 1 [Magnolia sinica]XP_058071648.1 protein gamma response 1 [Magnolia sinica]XP_058071655.1 protein gamma response 1 [Magnolia sinica]XP_058071661.1 protein gamma response 1 [Magnolia sinica]XP_058071666.1 protein gamma response 1 [Magnolia s
MEGELQTSPVLDYSIDDDDSKYFAGLSTILVATIQEVKDRISQIEFIFCSQLFPNFQSRTRSLRKKLVDARKAAEDDWKKKENSLLHQIEELRHEKLLAEEQNQHILASLEGEKAKLSNTEQLLHMYETEKKELLAKLESLEKNREVAELQEQLRQKAEEKDKGKELEEQLLQQIDLKDRELLGEQNKRKGATAQYVKLKKSFKELKSQYNFLLKRSCSTAENKLAHNRMEEERDSSRHHQIQQGSPGSRSENPDTTRIATKPNEGKNETGFPEKLDDEKGARSIQNLDTNCNVKLPSTSNSFHAQKSPVNAKCELLAGVKRSSSCWRDTRLRQEPGGADPHDDFLDTPLENAKINRNKAPKGDVLDIPAPAPKDMDFENSDDETQDLNADGTPPKQHVSIPRPENRGFKFVEPVRKKAERENLKGVECKQCKKFYDAVLPDGDRHTVNDNNNNINGGHNIHCEHHDGVSRHRYRYVPPMTPEGFWNIGFDSDI